MAKQHLPGDPEAGLDWLKADGPQADVVLSTRIRLARNLQGYRFGHRADAPDRAEVLRLARAAAEGTRTLKGSTALVIPDLAPAARQLLLERHLVSRELVGQNGAAPPSDAALLMAAGAPLS